VWRRGFNKGSILTALEGKREHYKGKQFGENQRARGGRFLEKDICAGKGGEVFEEGGQRSGMRQKVSVRWAEPANWRGGGEGC